jgi:hypothetical protein
MIVSMKMHYFIVKGLFFVFFVGLTVVGIFALTASQTHASTYGYMSSGYSNPMMSQQIYQQPVYEHPDFRLNQYPYRYQQYQPCPYTYHQPYQSYQPNNYGNRYY